VSPPKADAAVSRADPLALAITIALLLALAVWLISPRFSLTGPTLVDDWANLDNAPTALDELVRLSYDPAEAHDTRRYRPGYTAVWNSLQWRTLGGPDQMTGPNFWEVVRLAILIAGVVILTAFSLRVTARRLSRVEIAAWSAVPALLLIMTPELAVDLARLGPVEPLLIGAMALGGALTLVGLRRLVAGGGRDGLGRAAVTIAALACGYALWLLGAYQKEASICALALLPFLYLTLDRKWRSEGIIDRPLHVYWPVRIAAVALVLPLLHVFYEISQVTEGGVTVYGTDVPSGLDGWISRLWDGAQAQWQRAQLLSTSMWVAVAAAVPWLLLGWAARHRRPPWLVLGLLATAVGAYLFQGLGSSAETRYYIPVFALVAVVAVQLLVDGPRWLQAVAIAGVLVFAAQGLDARDAVRGWANEQQEGIDAVANVARLDPGHCPTYMALMHAEDADAFPELVAREPRPAQTGCRPPYVAYMIQGRTANPPVTNEAIYKTCAGKGWVELKQTGWLNYFGCRRLTTRRIYGQAPDDVLRWNRLVPGQRLSERIHALPDSALCEGAQCRQLLSQVREMYR
jgi:hypothetical protein